MLFFCVWLDLGRVKMEILWLNLRSFWTEWVCSWFSAGKSKFLSRCFCSHLIISLYPSLSGILMCVIKFWGKFCGIKHMQKIDCGCGFCLPRRNGKFPDKGKKGNHWLWKSCEVNWVGSSSPQFSAANFAGLASSQNFAAHRSRITEFLGLPQLSICA